MLHTGAITICVLYILPYGDGKLGRNKCSYQDHSWNGYEWLPLLLQSVGNHWVTLLKNTLAFPVSNQRKAWMLLKTRMDFRLLVWMVFHSKFYYRKFSVVLMNCSIRLLPLTTQKIELLHPGNRASKTGLKFSEHVHIEAPGMGFWSDVLLAPC